MAAIILDSNIWIYLCNDSFFELWEKLKEVKDQGHHPVFVNDIIIKEWNRNKVTTISNLVKNIKSEYRSALNLSHYFQGEEKAAYLKAISAYKEEEKRIQKATERVEEVEKFMLSCKKLEVTQHQMLFVANLAIEKEPPFQNNKNNFNDALLVRSICEAAESTFPDKYDLIFVSNNPSDFLNKETKQVHESLLKGLKPIRLLTVTELGEALKLAPELIDEFDDWLESQLENQVMYELDVMRGK